MKTVSEAQIAQLYVFTRKHFVEHYDLQTELVDHLANHIEKQWIDHPKLNFDQTLDNAFKPFGIFGFQDVVAARSKALHKQYYKLVWAELKHYFKPPKIILALNLLFVIFFILNTTLINKTILVGFFVVLFLYWGTQVYRLHKLKKARFKKTNKKWLLEDIIFNAGQLGVLLNLIVQPHFLFLDETLSTPWVWVYSGFLTLTLLIFHICFYTLPKMADKHLEKTYPEYKFEII